MANSEQSPTKASPGRKLRLGSLVFAGLVCLKIGEYLIARSVTVGDWPYLTLTAIVSAVLIVVYYKHISQLWHSGGKNHG